METTVMGNRDPKKKQTAIKAIRAFCSQTCCAGDLEYTRECPSKECSLWPFRMGRNPNISEETKAKLRERMNGVAPPRKTESNMDVSPTSVG